MTVRLICMLTACVAVAEGYTYDYAKNPVVSDSARWQVGGSGTSFNSGGVTFPGSGGWLLSVVPISGVSSDYEVDTTLALKSGGGTYSQFFRTDKGFLAGSGNYISVELAIPSGFQSPGMGTMTINQSVAGTVTQLSASQAVSASDGMTIKSVIAGQQLFVYINNTLTLYQAVATGTGNPGIGGHDIPAGSGIGGVMLGPHSTTPPPALNRSTIASSIFPQSVSLKWPGGTPGADGIGVVQYYVVRDGVPLSYLFQPIFTDSTVHAAESHTYVLQAVDYHGNFSPATPVTVVTPPVSHVDPRRVGLFTTGAYWGGGGEQIDVLSGNLNFSLPLVTPQGRTGWKVPVGLSYNSQNWRQDNGVNWQLGTDVGYGFGWQVRIGSLTPYHLNWWTEPDHYVYTNSSGAEYRLDEASPGIWASTQGIYVWFDSAAGILHFKDGTFWVMGCTSGGTEADAGTIYPTIIEDVSGNQVIVSYLAGIGVPANSPNSSARIDKIIDVRSNTCSPNPYSCPVYFSYGFFYNADAPLPHLANITSYIGTAERYTFTYVGNVINEPPFGTDTLFGQTIIQLSAMALPSVGSYGFTYDPAGASELTQTTFPWGGHLQWAYQNFTYSAGRTMREVASRSLAADSAGATTWTHIITRPDAPNQVTLHTSMTLTDASGVGAKTWQFLTPVSGTLPWQNGLVSQFIQLSAQSGSVLTHDTLSWAQDGGGNPYVSTRLSVSDEGTANQQSAKTAQTIDQYGNVTNSVLFPYNDAVNPLRTYVSTYLTDSGYVSAYVRNRLVNTTLTFGSTTKSLVTYGYSPSYYFQQPASPTFAMDATPPVLSQYRGLLSWSQTPRKQTRWQYYNWGTAAYVWDSEGNMTTASADTATNYAAPMTITTATYSESLAYNSWLGVTQTTGLNGEQLLMAYDTNGRPTTGTSPYGSTETYTYSAASALPAWQMKTGPDGVTKTTLDGLGRPIRVERGDSYGMKGVVDTVYAACACSPLGKVKKVSQAYAPGTPSSNITWTVNTYDGIGRTLSVTQPDGASTTRYVYAGNVTTVTDPAGKWKQFTNDVEGNLVTVVEPNPASSGTLTTTYTYDWMKNLTGVSMPRGSVTQTRTFLYDDAGRLTLASNPENGVVNYYYSASGDNTLLYKHDAKGQETVYTYDAQKRVTMVQRFPNGQPPLGNEDLPARVIYTYGVTTTGPSLPPYTAGRLASVTYGAPH